MKLIKLNLPIDFNAIQTGELRYFFKPYVWDDVGYNYIFENQSIKNAQDSSSIQDTLVSHLHINSNAVETTSIKVKDSISPSLNNTIKESTNIQELDQNTIQEVIILDNDKDIDNYSSHSINNSKDTIQTVNKDNNSLNNEYTTATSETQNSKQNNLNKDNIEMEAEGHENNIMNDILSSYKNITKRYNS